MPVAEVPRRGRLVGAAVAVLLVLAGPAAAQEAPGVDLGAYGGTLRFEAPPGVTFEVPDVGRFVDTLIARIAPDGDLVLINDLPMDEYVLGIAEMPARWPIESLKAQAVAARTYAWYQTGLRTFEARGYDICPTTACQVFDGRSIVELPELGDRWRSAVEATSGEVVLHEGGPILARYFSTSGGSTRNNEDVFPSEGAFPYLKAVEDPRDDVSPLHEWQVRFDRDDFDLILSKGETLAAASPFETIELVPAAVTGRTDRVQVTGRTGRVAEVSASAFRAFISDVAPEAFPDLYPSARADGKSLPAALPSSRFTFTVTDDEVVIDGRGWGHGVGMSQWGANGMGEDGADYREILTHYYTGVTVGPSSAMPQRIRVGLASEETAGGGFAISADGPFRVVAGSAVITDRGLGTWRVGLRPDRSTGLTGPEGYGAPLVVSTTETTRPAPTEIEIVTLEAVVNKATELALVVTDAEGGEVVRHDLGVAEAGRHATTWDLDRADGSNLPAGAYTAALVATDEDGVTAGEAVTLDIRAITSDGPPASLLGVAGATTPSGGGVTPLVLATLLGLALGAGVGAVVPLRAR